MKRNGSTRFALAAMLVAGCATDDGDSAETMSATADSGADTGDDAPASGGTADDGSGADDGSDDRPGDDGADGPADDDGGEGDADCQAVCADATACGYDETTCIADCSEIVSDLAEPCANAYVAWSVCLASEGCDDEADCSTETDALYDVCEANDEITSTCAAYCGTLDECAPGELYEDLGECIIECEVDSVLVGPACSVADLGLLSCYGALSCEQWDTVGTDDSPCTRQEQAYEEVCF